MVVDPKGGTLDQCGRFLQREKYRVRVFNSIDFSKSMHYNPLAYIKTESDVLKFVTALIANTKGDGKEGDEFWTKAEMCIRDRLYPFSDGNGKRTADGAAGGLDKVRGGRRGDPVSYTHLDVYKRQVCTWV